MVKRQPKLSKTFYAHYDLVVFHSFGDLTYPEIFNVPKTIPKIWLGWGFDYYDLIGGSYLLPETRLTVQELEKKFLISSVREAIRFTLVALGVSRSKKSAIEKLTLFAPVLTDEYELVRKAINWRSFPQCGSWNYGTIEDNLIKGFEDEQVDSDAILIGNSASTTCNHIDTLKFLNSLGLNDRKIIAPLSYGDKRYGERVCETGRRYFGENFNPLLDFLPVKDYVATIKKCGFVIMNHQRQQAVGNIVIMLYLGARVFVREENTVYRFFRGLGVSLSTVQELEQNPLLLNKPLTAAERASNRRIVSDYWSRERGIKRTRDLVEQAMGARG